TTRDVVDIQIHKGGRNYLLLDTAGLRKKFKVVDAVEKFSTIKTLKAIDRCDVVVLVLDASEDLTTQDQKIAAEVIERGKGLLVAVNKWDLKRDSEHVRRMFREEVYAWAPFLKFAALRFCSALSGQGVDQLLVEAWRIRERMRKKYSQS